MPQCPKVYTISVPNEITYLRWRSKSLTHADEKVIQNQLYSLQILFHNLGQAETPWLQGNWIQKRQASVPGGLPAFRAGMPLLCTQKGKRMIPDFAFRPFRGLVHQKLLKIPSQRLKVTAEIKVEAEIAATAKSASPSISDPIT